MKLALIQMAVQKDKRKNLGTVARFIDEAAMAHIDVAILPEMFYCPYQTTCFPEYAEDENGPAFRFLAELSAKYHIYIIAGSLPERDRAGHVYNTSYVFDRNGKLLAKHRKMHLFDIDIEGGQHFKESETLTAGNAVTVFDSEFGRIGLAICYDIRFPELSRLMVDKGAKIIIVPAAFNLTTGPAHWDLLFRSRAVDNQVYMVGVSSARDVSSNYISYGNSLIVSPWGKILHQLDEKEGILIADIELDLVEKIRKELPLLQHRRKDIYTLSLNT